jgi:hypothetical protein
VPFAGVVQTQWDKEDDEMMVVFALSYLDPKGRMWSVPAGFVTDGASIPRFLWSIIGPPFNGRYRVPALFHDAAYCEPGMNRAAADRMFFDAMREEGVSYIKARAMWAGVRIGGGKPFAEAQRAALAIG